MGHQRNQRIHPGQGFLGFLKEMSMSVKYTFVIANIMGTQKPDIVARHNVIYVKHVAHMITC